MHKSFRILLCISTIATVSVARAGCALSGNHASPTLVKKFASSRSEFLAGFPRGGLPLQGTVSALVAMDSANAAKIVLMVLLANEQQQLAIAKGLRWISDYCGAHDPELAQRIRRYVLNSGSPALIMQYDRSENLGDDIAGTPTQVGPITSPPVQNAPSSALSGFVEPNARPDMNEAVAGDPFAPFKPLP